MSTTWRNKLRPASFRGVEFGVKEAELSTGRRTAKHEFPGKDIGYTEDLGRKLRGFPLQGFVIGSNYMLLRDRLISACEKSGSGQLIHPYLGTKEVVCLDCKVREVDHDGGMAIFSLVFDEAGELVYPAATSDALSQLSAAADDVQSAAAAVLEAIYDVGGLVGAAIAAVQDKLNSVTDVIDSAVMAAKAVYRITASTAFALKNMKAQILNAIAAPSQIAEILNSALDTFKGLGTSPQQIRDAYRGMIGFGSSSTGIVPGVNNQSGQSQSVGSFPSSTPVILSISRTKTNLQVTATKQAIVNYVQQLSIAKAAVAVSQAPGASYQEATALRDEISSAIDSQLQTVTDDTLYLALTKMQTLLRVAVPPQKQTLGSVISITPDRTSSSLVLLYDQFESLAQEADLLARNGIVNPSFLTAKKDLKVIQSG